MILFTNIKACNINKIESQNVIKWYEICYDSEKSCFLKNYDIKSCETCYSSHVESVKNMISIYLKKCPFWTNLSPKCIVDIVSEFLLTFKVIFKISSKTILFLTTNKKFQNHGNCNYHFTINGLWFYAKPAYLQKE